MTHPLPIRQSPPSGRVTRPEEGIPVVATVRWGATGATTVLARATAWTSGSVEISWTMPGIGPRSDWIPAADVTRAPADVVPPPGPPVARPRRHR